MNAPLWLLWLGGTALPLGALWALWRLALRPERCYGYNRALLLLAPVVAAVLPLLPRLALPAWLAGSDPGAAAAPVAVLPALVVPALAAPVAASWSGWHWLVGVYVAGLMVGLGRLAWQVGRLHWLAHHLPQAAGPGYVLVHTGGQLPISSFGRFIFWNETAALTTAESVAVLAHETAHVRQRHTWDVLWLESWRAVLWPNPFAHLLLPALRLTHELLADRAAATTVAESDSIAYPALLARLAAQRLAGPAAFPLLQPFTFSFTLTRIAMLKNQIPVRRWKQWLVLPVLVALSFVTGHAASAQPIPANPQAAPKLTEAQKKERLAIISHKLRVAQREDSLRTGNKLEPGTKQQFHITNWNGPGEPVVTVTRVKAGGPDGTVGIEPNSAGAYVPAPQPPHLLKKGQDSTPTGADGAHVYTYVEQMPQLPGGGNVAAIVKQIQNNLVYPAGERKEGRVFVRFTVSDTGEVHDARIIKGLSDSYDAATLAAVEKLPNFVPGQQAGQPVAVSFTVPILFKNTP